MLPRILTGLLLILALGIFGVNASDLAALPNSATIKFGDHNAGSPFPPGSGHDRSYHAHDKMVPRDVVIAAGGEVTFQMTELHQAAIYMPGTGVDDIEVSPATLRDLVVPCVPVPLEDFVIDDPTNRVALSPAASCDEIEWTTPAGTFDTPGKYLVICTTTPHFAEADMYGWVTVK